jgi:addiction module HigA family antidote
MGNNVGVKSNSYLKYEPDYAVPPGETLLETIEHLGMTQAELAERTGRPKKTINEIIKGKAAITPETARQLERVLGVPASFWNNLERNYREKLAEIEERERLKLQGEWLKEIPVNTMVKYGWVKRFSGKIEQLQEVLNFFSVASVEAWREVWKKILGGTQMAFRHSLVFKSEPGAVAAWIRKGQIESQKIECKPFKASNFHKALEKIRALTNEPPEVFVLDIVKICADAGVAVVFVPELPKSRVSGSAYWLNSEKAVIQLSLRYRTDDHLWFTFFHEAGHILQNQKREIFLEYTCLRATHRQNGWDGEDDEKQANKYASEALIPQSLYKDFIKRGTFNSRTIEGFARNLGIAPGIVVGRLQHDKVIPFATNLNKLKKHFKWS